MALGKDPAYVMRQMGHTHAIVTLGIYALVMQASDADRERLRALVERNRSISVSSEGRAAGSYSPVSVASPSPAG